MNSRKQDETKQFAIELIVIKILEEINGECSYDILDFLTDFSWLNKVFQFPWEVPKDTSNFFQRKIPLGKYKAVSHDIGIRN